MTTFIFIFSSVVSICAIVIFISRVKSQHNRTRLTSVLSEDRIYNN